MVRVARCGHSPGNHGQFTGYLNNCLFAIFTTRMLAVISKQVAGFSYRMPRSLYKQGPKVAVAARLHTFGFNTVAGAVFPWTQAQMAGIFIRIIEAPEISQLCH